MGNPTLDHIDFFLFLKKSLIIIYYSFFFHQHKSPSKFMYLILAQLKVSLYTYHNMSHLLAIWMPWPQVISSYDIQASNDEKACAIDESISKIEHQWWDPLMSPNDGKTQTHSNPLSSSHFLVHPRALLHSFEGALVQWNQGSGLRDEGIVLAN